MLQSSTKPADLTPYASQVYQYGGEHPYRSADGQRFNLSRKTIIQPNDVITDSKGNITAIPLLERLPCFARPERSMRGIYSAWRIPERPSGCERCYSSEACCNVALDRIDSDADVQRTFYAWFEHAETLPRHRRFRGPAALLWDQFLQAIIRHGGWTTVNDAAVAAAEIIKREKRAAAKRASAGRSRAARSSKTALRRPITPEFQARVDAARDKLLQDLVMLSQQKPAPRWLSKLDHQGCARTADVWRAVTLLRRANQACSQREIAELLIRRGDVFALNPESLRAKMSVVVKRLEKLKQFAPHIYPTLV